MNDNDLERQLRTQAGPREEGYVPTRLPTSPDDARSRRPSPVMRAAVLVPAVAAGVLVVVVAAAAIRGFGSDGSTVGGGSENPTASAATDGEPIACAADDLVFPAEPWGGAAGSRGTVVSVALNNGSAPCLLSTGVSGQIIDVNGHVVISSTSVAMLRPERLLRPGDVFSIGVAWSNFCGDTPSGRLSLQIRFGSIPQWITVAEAASVPRIPVPPCMGENEPGILSLTNLQANQ